MQRHAFSLHMNVYAHKATHILGIFETVLNTVHKTLGKFH